MSVVPESTFARQLRRLDHGEFVSFVARLWSISGWETETEKSVITATAGERTERLLVLTGGRFARFRRVPSVSHQPDYVVTARRLEESERLPRGTPECPVIDADGLRHRLLYGVDTDDADELCREVLGIPSRDGDWETGRHRLAGASDRLSSVVGDEGGPPLSRRATLGLLGFGVLGGVGFAAQSRLRGQGGETGSFDDDPPPTPGTVRPEISVEFEYQRGVLTIRHAGGDTVDAGSLAVVGEGFPGEPERRWSDWTGYAEGSPVNSGSTIQLNFEADGRVEIVWEGGGVQATLASFAGPDADPSEENEGSERVSVPDVSVSFSFGNGSLTITNAGLESFRASRVVFRGTGFNDGEPYRWSDSAAVVDASRIAAGQSISIAAEPTITLQVWWEHESRDPVLLDQFIGPDRPLSPDVGGVRTFGYGPANRGVTGEQTGPVSGVTEQWVFETSGPVGSTATVVGGRVHVGSLDGNLYTLDAVDGAELWRFETADGIRRASPTVGADTVYVASEDGNLYAVDPEQGEKRWAYPGLRQVLSSPTVADVDGPKAFVTGIGPAETGMIAAVDATDGTERWRFDLGEEPSSAPAVVDDTVYIGGAFGSAYALDAGDGSVRWQFQEPENRRSSTAGIHVMDSPPAVHDGTVYIGSTSDFLYALDAADGTEQWAFETGGPIGGSAAIVPAEDTAEDGDSGGSATVYVGSRDWKVYALEASDGTERWQYETGGPIFSSPTVVSPSGADSGTVYVGSFDSRVYALDAGEGTERWQYGTENQVLASPVVASGTLYVGSGDGRVYALTEP